MILKKTIKYLLNNLVFCFILLLSFFKRYSKNQKFNDKNIAWFGAYGNTNIGDDLIFFSLQKYIPTSWNINLSCRRIDQSSNYSVSTFNKGENVYDILGNINIIKKANLVILGGGGLFESYNNKWEATRLKMAYLSPLIIAKIFGIPYIIIGVGCNDSVIKNFLLKIAFRYITSNATLIIARDKKSKKGFVLNGCKSNICWTYDPVFSYNHSKCNCFNNNNKNKNILFLLWPYYLWPTFYDSMNQINAQKKALHDQFVKNTIEIVAKLREKGYNVIFGRFHFSDDYVVNEIGERIVSFDNLDQYFKIVESSYCVVSMRYHGQITALLSNKPVISIPVQEKMEELIKNLNLEDYSISPDKFDWVHFENFLDKINIEDHIWRKVFRNVGKYSAEVSLLYRDKINHLLN